ncbi:daunorubicin/doxorubicin resistance ABC transporter ATP-binding protein DrrA [Candidatus Saccharibacteria bacterium RIFCSPHIGHO2_02_FULL_47_12]|nr:MAG: daunorubicin/doxorubicin resistance ABC transporter ATP-binding protein DrrA [Candidatus Saccharibacteria bacterium RIFCSPHIGHO2_02_FULL_47_12]
MVRGTAHNAIEVRGLRKSYGKLKVLNGINFKVPTGSILALLGPNGAGKTTTIRILSTLLQPDDGKAYVAGHDVVEEPFEVKQKVGLTGQYAAVDQYLSGEENLLMIGRLYRLSKQDVQRRTSELIKLFDLVEASKRPVRTYSGGMRRRLDLAMSLIAAPPIIFLDEPTTGLDPRSRQTMWEIIKKLAASGTTILLTTQYMEEADHLADNIVVIDDGKVIAEGTPNALKARAGSDRSEIVLVSAKDLDKAKDIIDGQSLQIDETSLSLSVSSKNGTKQFRQILEELEKAKIPVESFSLHRPSLDDVFLKLTGHKATKEETSSTKKGKK